MLALFNAPSHIHIYAQYNNNKLLPYSVRIKHVIIIKFTASHGLYAVGPAPATANQRIKQNQTFRLNEMTFFSTLTHTHVVCASAVRCSQLLMDA